MAYVKYSVKPGEVSANWRRVIFVNKGQAQRRCPACRRMMGAPAIVPSHASQKMVREVQREVAGYRSAEGPCVVVVRSTYTTRHRKGPASGLPKGDVDNPSKTVLDALKGGPYFDDAQVVAALLVKTHGTEPMVEAVCRPLSDVANELEAFENEVASHHPRWGLTELVFE